MNQLSDWPGERAERHATALLYDSAECRLVAFTLAARQEVKVHTSSSTVLCTVVGGDGTFVGSGDTVALAVGESVQYQPDEPHGMIAGANGLRFLAVITPGPTAAR